MMISDVRQLRTSPSHTSHDAPSLQSTFLWPHQFPPRPQQPLRPALMIKGRCWVFLALKDDITYTEASFLNILPCPDFWNFENTPKAHNPPSVKDPQHLTVRHTSGLDTRRNGEQGFRAMLGRLSGRDSWFDSEVSGEFSPTSASL